MPKPVPLRRRDSAFSSTIVGIPTCAVLHTINPCEKIHRDCSHKGRKGDEKEEWDKERERRKGKSGREKEKRVRKSRSGSRGPGNAPYRRKGEIGDGYSIYY